MLLSLEKLPGLFKKVAKFASQNLNQPASGILLSLHII